MQWSDYATELRVFIAIFLWVLIMNGKARFPPNGVYRVEIRFAIAVFLVMYCLFASRQKEQLIGRLRNAENVLKIFQQMQDYAQNVCAKKEKKPTLDVGKDMETVKRIKRQEVSGQTVDQEITFILMAPTLRCIHNTMLWIRDRYKKVKIIVAVDVRIYVLNEENPFDSTVFERGYFLGGFDSRAEILNKAIEMISTKYFIVLDHSINLDKMQGNFVEKLLLNMPGFDVLSGSEIDSQGVFNIPCYRLRLSNWTFYETYEYNIIGNVLQCDSTSLFFVGRTEAFKDPVYNFDTSLPSKWLQDFFIRYRGILEVGVVPEVVIHRTVPDHCHHAPPPVLSISEKVELLLPFVNKHQIFYFNNGTNRLSVCKHSLRMFCSEQSISKKWSLFRHFSAGLTTYPFIIESLKEALHFGTRYLEESHLLYALEGGTLLGLIKLRDILPWDHGDIDTFVYSTRRSVINMVKKTRKENKYLYWLRHTGFHTYVSNPPSVLNGCIVYLTKRVKPKGFIYLRHSGKLFPVDRQVFKFLRQFYGSSYFESHMKTSDVRSYCDIPGHHACMPDCRWDGCGGGRGAFPGIL